jgi:hypothetical protein
MFDTLNLIFDMSASAQRLICLCCLLAFAGLAFAGPFDRLGERALMTATSECREVEGYDVSPDGGHVLYYGPPRKGDAHLGVWLDARLLLQCDSAIEYGFTQASKPYFIYLAGGRSYVYFDRAASKGYAEVIYDSTSEDRIVLSPDGNHLAVRVRDGVWVRVLRDLVPGQPYTTVTDLLFSLDGRNLFYLAQQGNGWLLVTDEKPGKAYEGATGLALAPRTRRPLYIATAQGRQMLVRGNREDRPRGKITELTFTAEDSLPCYLASDSFGWRVIVDTQSVASLQALFLHSLNYRPGIQEPLYVMVDYGFRSQLMSGSLPASAACGHIDHVAVSPDGKSFAYVALDSATRSIFVNDTALPIPGELMSALMVSPDSRHWAWVVATRDAEGRYTGTSVYRDRTVFGAYAEVAELQFNPHTSELVGVARNTGRYFVAIDGNPGTEYDGVGHLTFGPDGRLGYLAVKGDQACYVVAGHEGKWYEDVGGLQFSPNGKRIAYAAKQGNTFYWVCG